MATEKPRFTVTFEPEIYDDLERYWRINGYKNRNQAINELLLSALSKPEVFGPDELNVIRNYKKAEPIVKETVKGALNYGAHYADTHLSHRMPGRALSDSTPQPFAEINGGTLTYAQYDDNGELVSIIDEKIPGLSRDKAEDETG